MKTFSSIILLLCSTLWAVYGAEQFLKGDYKWGVAFGIIALWLLGDSLLLWTL